MLFVITGVCMYVFIPLRNAERLIHIPFWKDDLPACQRKREEELSSVAEHVSSAIGVFISIGEKLKSKKVQRDIRKSILPFVQQVLPSANLRVQKCYALILAISKEVCCSFVNII